MGFLDFFKSKKDGTTSTYGFVSKDGKKGLSFEEATKLRDEFLAIATQNDENKEFNAAANLMLKQAYDACIEAYSLLSEKYPDSFGTCQGQIGVAYFFKEEYDKALSYYIVALEKGEEKSIMDDNIWEVTEILYQNTQDKQYLERYKQLFPQGSYLKNANKLLS